MRGDGVYTWIHTCPQRDGRTQPVLDSIWRSDVTSPHVMRQPEGENPQAFFFRAWRQAIEASRSWGRAYVLRLEDDVVVHPRTVQLLTTWAAAEEEDFGAAWLSTPTGICDNIRNNPLVDFGKTSGALKRNHPDIHGALGVALPTHLASAIIDAAEKTPLARWCLQDDSEINFDMTISQAVWSLGKRVYMHFPLLVAPDGTDKPSVAGTSTGKGVTFEPFDPEWRRLLP